MTWCSQSSCLGLCVTCCSQSSGHSIVGSSSTLCMTWCSQSSCLGLCVHCGGFAWSPDRKYSRGGWSQVGWVSFYPNHLGTKQEHQSVHHQLVLCRPKQIRQIYTWTNYQVHQGGKSRRSLPFSQLWDAEWTRGWTPAPVCVPPWGSWHPREQM